MKRRHKGRESGYDEIDTVLKRARTSIEHGLETMQSRDRQNVKQIWQELVSMIEARDSDLEKLAGKLDEFNQKLVEYLIRSQVLATNSEMKVV